MLAPTSIVRPGDDEGHTEDVEDGGIDLGRKGAGLNQSELVPAKPGDRLDLRTQAREGLGDLLDQRIPDGMAPGIVDRLEPVEIDEMEREFAIAEPQVLKAADVLQQTRAVEEPGQAIMGASYWAALASLFSRRASTVPQARMPRRKTRRMVSAT